MNRFVGLITTACLLAMPSLASATVIHVPSEQPTIQAGIDAAVWGDTVMVAPGLYTENISFQGKGILVSSTDGAVVTTIEAATASEAAVLMTNAEPRGAEIRGFTITGGGRGGIRCSGSSPTIRDNIITGNASSDGNEGGGIDLRNTSGSVVRGNRIFGNDAETYGAGIHIMSGSYYDTIAYCIFYDNDGYHDIRILEHCTGLLIHNNTIWPAVATGIANWSGGEVIARNNIVFNAPHNGMGGTGVAAEFNCTFNNGWSDYDNVAVGTGNIYVDATFADTAGRDFSLDYESPCINTGDPDPSFNDPNGSRNDMGALPYGGIFDHIVAVYPAPNAYNVPPNANITVEFDVEMDSSSINGNSFLVTGGKSGQTPAMLSYDASTLTATYNPVTDLEGGEVVTAELTVDIMTELGDHLDSAAMWVFAIDSFTQCQEQVLHSSGLYTGMDQHFPKVAQKVVGPDSRHRPTLVRFQVANEVPWGGNPEDNGNPQVAFSIYNQTVNESGDTIPNEVIYSTTFHPVYWPEWNEVEPPDHVEVEGNYWVGWELITGDPSTDYFYHPLDSGLSPVNGGAWGVFEAWNEWISMDLLGGLEGNNWLIEVEFCSIPEYVCVDSDGDEFGDPEHPENTCPEDNCPDAYNPDQTDSDGDGFGDECDLCPDSDDLADLDDDTVPDGCDNCPSEANPGQSDSDLDLVGDVCDNCDSIPNAGQEDSDSDGVGDVCDNCSDSANVGQEDTDLDGIGDACDICPADSLNDADADSVCGDVDNCPTVANPDQADQDSNGIGDACCCGYYTGGYSGNTNCDTEGNITLSDITRLIDRVYISKQLLCCERSGDTNGDWEYKITLSDITELIDHVYISKGGTAPCEH